MNVLPARRPDLEIQDVGTEVIVHNPQSKSIHVLNRSAGVVLRACDGETPVTAVQERLNAGTADVASDVQRVLSDFGTLGLLQ